MLCPFFHLHGQVKALNSLWEPRVILYQVGGAHLPPRGKLFQHQGGKARPGSVQGGGVARRAPAHNEHIIHLVFHD